jgi:cytochrome c556
MKFAIAVVHLLAGDCAAARDSGHTLSHARKEGFLLQTRVETGARYQMKENRRMKTIATLALAALTAAAALPAAAQSFQKPEDAIKYRRSVMTVLGAHFGVLGAMANGRVPYDAAAAARSGDAVALVSHLPWAGFVPGSDKGETKAKPEIWTEQAKFKEAQEKMQADVGRIAAAAKTGNLDQLKAAWAPNAGSCKACHDNFRKE